MKWHKAEGDGVRAGEPLLDIETEKAVFEVEAETTGVLGAEKVSAQGREKLPVGTVLGVIGGAEKVPPVLSQPSATEPVAEALSRKVSPSAKRRAREQGIALEGVIGTGTGGRIITEDVARAADNGRTTAENHARAFVNKPNAMRRAVGQRMKTDVEKWGKVVRGSPAPRSNDPNCRSEFA